ncbi:glycosyltransferase [Caldimonas tepidiphila]|uniref:glycosyltransferase n=1 Tax=Caldimonas tepidiphila TaxID=2315841 RepID=UPI000E5B468A|nr:glycosyltransferase [Caldimonas tepidiphila]
MQQPPCREAPVPATPALSVLIVTRDSTAYIGRLLAGIRAECRQIGAEVIVLDNASSDGTPALIERDHDWVTLRCCLINLGVSVATNLAARLASAPVLLLLHPEALPAPGSLHIGLTKMQAHPDVAVAGGCLVLPRPARPPARRTGTLRLAKALALAGLATPRPGSLFGRFAGEGGEPGPQADAPWVSGPLLFLHAGAFRALGGFDERFFQYYEDVDLCRRARQAGWRVCHWRALRARPLAPKRAQPQQGTVPPQVPSPGGEPASGVTPAARSPLARWHIRSRLLYFRKHHGWAAAWLVNRTARAWHALLAWHHRRRQRPAEAEEAHWLTAQLRHAWTDTLGGRVSPPRPW